MPSEWEVEYVRRVLDATGLAPTALAKKAGFAASTLTRALNDTEHKFRLSTTTLERIRAATGIPYSGHGEDTARHVRTFIQVYDIAEGSALSELVDHRGEVCNMAFDAKFLGQMTPALPPDIVMLKVRGPSMEPTLVDGDHVLVDKTDCDLGADGMFVLEFNGALHVKRIGRSARRGNVMVISDHPAYPGLDMPAKELDVIGRVLWMGRRIG